MQVKIQLFGKADDIERTLQRIAQAMSVISVGDAAPQCPLNSGGRCIGGDSSWVYRLAVINPDVEPEPEVITSTNSI
jgi:hypothetical protein